MSSSLICAQGFAAGRSKTNGPNTKISTLSINMSKKGAKRFRVFLLALIEACFRPVVWTGH